MHQNIPQKALFVLIIGLIIWFSAGYLLPLFLPFLLGAVLAVAADPMVRLLRDKAHLPRSLATAVGVSSVCILSVAVLGLGLAVLVRQVQNIGNILPRIEQAVTQGLLALQNLLTELAGKLPENAGRTATKLVNGFFSDGTSVLGQAAQKLAQAAGSALSGLSKGIFCIITGVLSGYMLSIRLPQLRRWLQQRLPNSWQEKYRPLLKDLRKAMIGWLQAELKLAGTAFLLLCIGFWLLRVENTLTIATLVTIVDAFPVLGVGTVLIPWSAICLLQGHTARGIGLLGLFSVIWLVRSALEPKLVGKSIGLDPLLTLAAIYIGFQLWGVAGMLLAPILALMTAQTVKQLQH